MKEKIKLLLRTYPILLDIVALVYSLVFSPSYWRYLFNPAVQCRGVFLYKTRIRICGKGCRISIGRTSKLVKCKLLLLSDNCEIYLKSGGVKNTSFYLEDSGSKIFIGNGFTMEGGHIASTEGEHIIIGDDCMFSGDVEIRNGDSHAILNFNTKRRINWATTVTIGNHVWLTAHVRVLKGCTIADNCIIGNSAIATGYLCESNSIYGGSPIRLLKKEVEWNRSRYDFNKP